MDREQAERIYEAGREAVIEALIYCFARHVLADIGKIFSRWHTSMKVLSLPTTSPSGPSAPLYNGVKYVSARNPIRSSGYKPAFSHETATAIIGKGDSHTSPDHFDPDVLEAFLKARHAFEDICNMYNNSMHE